MAVAVRYLDRFTSADGAAVVTFPIELYEWQSKQELRTAFSPIVGGDYAVDMLGGDPASKQPGAESLSFDVGEDSDGAINTLIDSLKADCYRIGSGKLWTTDAAGNRRWAWARATGMPGYAVNINNELVVPVALEFTRLSDWFGETLQTHTETITSTPHTFDLTTQGNAPVQAVVIRFRANGASSGELITNGTFEQDSAGWSAYNGATKSQTFADAYQGVASMEVVTPGAVAGEGAISDFYPAVAGATYRYRLRVKRGGGGGTIKAEAWAHDDSGFLANLQGSAAVTLDGTWQLITGEVIAPAGTTRLTITIYTDGLTEALTWWVDDVSLRRVGGYANPRLRNKTNGESFTVNRIAAGANDEIRVDTGRWACEVSTDDGLNYTSALTDLTLSNTQFNILTLAEGLNQMEFSDEGYPSLSLEISWHETFH